MNRDWTRVLEIARGMAAGPRELLKDDAAARQRANLADAKPLYDPTRANLWDPEAALFQARLRAPQRLELPSVLPYLL
jgi:hypothetical protein